MQTDENLTTSFVTPAGTAERVTPTAQAKPVEAAHAPLPQSTPAPAERPLTLTIIIPAYNEGDAVGAVIAKAHALRPDAEILVIDDGSKDNTSEAALAAGARVVRHP